MNYDGLVFAYWSSLKSQVTEDRQHYVKALFNNVFKTKREKLETNNNLQMTISLSNVIQTVNYGLYEKGEEL